MVLTELVKAYGSPAWKEAVGKMVREAYKPIMQLNLQSATPSLFNEEFKKTYNGADAVSRKCMTFFLNAVREAELPVSPRLLSGTKPRTAPTKRRVTKPARKGQTGQQKTEDTPPPSNPSKNDKLPSQIVFETFDPTSMPPEVQQATLTLLTYLKSIGR
jgi:hypothetical protein